jgi:hypothetical protein
MRLTFAANVINIILLTLFQSFRKCEAYWMMGPLFLHTVAACSSRTLITLTNTNNPQNYLFKAQATRGHFKAPGLQHSRELASSTIKQLREGFSFFVPAPRQQDEIEFREPVPELVKVQHFFFFLQRSFHVIAYLLPRLFEKNAEPSCCSRTRCCLGNPMQGCPAKHGLN